jgi:hypothetical protein
VLCIPKATLTSEAPLPRKAQACCAFQAHCHEARQTEGNRSQNIELGLTASCSLPCIKNDLQPRLPSSWRGHFLTFDRSPGAGHRSGRLSQGALPVSGMPWGYASASVAASWA